MRQSGLLLHITSLPSPFGIGTMGKAARDFLDFLEKSGQSIWQVLPIGPTSYGDSPYQSFSSFAGNPYLIDLDDLTQEGFLKQWEYASIHWGDDPGRVDYAVMYAHRDQVLRQAVKRLYAHLPEEFYKFRDEERGWLDDYALFMAIKRAQGGQSWMYWPKALRFREPDAMREMREIHQQEIDYWCGVQYLFYRQYDALKQLSHKKGIRMLGDLPIYTAYDSADVWASPEQFQLDEDLMPIEVAGCPPDSFSVTGQLWGNPLFDWDVMKRDGYQWWIRRIAFQFKIYDMLRMDHFRGFDAYYAIPNGDKTAEYGRWKPGPGLAFFERLEAQLGKCPMIAEDLGFITPSARKLQQDTGYPGMKVLQFAFDSRDERNDFLPHLYGKNDAVYTGTHDNDTTLGWFQQADPKDVRYAVEYFRLTKAEGYHWGMICAALGSVADYAIIPMQDLLGLGSEARMNTPSTVGNNWKWRLPPGSYDPALSEKLYRKTEIYGRIHRGY